MKVINAYIAENIVYFIVISNLRTSFQTVCMTETLLKIKK